MPTNSRIAPLELRDELERALRLLDVRHKVLADLSGASTGFIHNLLAGERVGNRELIRAVAGALDKELATAVATGSIERMDAVSISRSIENLRLYFGLVRRERKTLPGGAVPIHAVNYLNRSVDLNGWSMTISEAINEIMQTLPLSMLVHGPIHSGRTTFMKALEKELTSAGLSVAVFDAKSVDTASLSQDLITADGATLWILRQLSRIAKATWGITGPVPDDSDIEVSFVAWLCSELRHLEPCDRVLVIDNITSISASAAWKLTGILRVLHNERAIDDNVPTICVGFAHSSMAARRLLQSSMPILNTKVALRWFSEEETVSLASRRHVNLPLDTVQSVHSFFLGQPFVTDVALGLLNPAGSNWEEVVKRACQGDGVFIEHEIKLKDALKDGLGGIGIIGKEASSDDLRRDDIKYLTQSEIISAEGGRFAYSSPYYAAIVPRLLVEIGSGSSPSVARQ